MPRHTDPRRSCLPFAEWPDRDQADWTAGTVSTAPRFSTTARPIVRRAARSTGKFRQGYARWLGFLTWHGRLDPAVAPADRATLENLAAYFAELLELGNADYTLIGRFQELENALDILDPAGDHSHVTRPNGRSLRASLPMVKRDITIHHPADLYLWGLELMTKALTLNGAVRRRIMLRDGLLICILAFRGLRLRSVMSLTLGENISRNPETGLWRLDIDPSDVKNGKYISAMLPEILAPWLDRYIDVERQELLNCKRSDAFWINWGGDRLEEKGLDKRIRWLSEKRFGVDGAFGTHRFRHCIATASPLIHPEHPHLAAALLRITHGVANQHYDRSGAVLAYRAFHAAIATERDATASIAQAAFREQDTRARQLGLDLI